MPPDVHDNHSEALGGAELRNWAYPKVANAAALPTLAADLVGTIYTTSDDNANHRWNGSDWHIWLERPVVQRRTVSGDLTGANALDVSGNVNYIELNLTGDVTDVDVTGFDSTSQRVQSVMIQVRHNGFAFPWASLAAIATWSNGIPAPELDKTIVLVEVFTTNGGTVLRGIHHANTHTTGTLEFDFSAEIRGAEYLKSPDRVTLLSTAASQRRLGEVRTAEDNGHSYQATEFGFHPIVRQDIGGINIFEYAPGVEDGSEDLGAAINAAIAEAPISGGNYDHMRTMAIRIPSNPDRYQYTVTTKIVVPENKNVSIVGDAPNSVELINATGDPYMIRSEGVSISRVFNLYGLGLNGGSVELVDDNRGHIRISSCRFVNTTVPGIHLTAPASAPPAPEVLGTVGFKCDDNEFVFCAGGVWIENGTYLIDRLFGNRFISMDDHALIIDGPGVNVLYNDFQGMLEAQCASKAFVHLRGRNSASLINLTGNRFGSEAYAALGKNYDVPSASIIIGDETLLGEGACSGLNMSGNHFLGRSLSFGGPVPGFSDYLIRATTRPRFVRLSGMNTIRHYGVAVVSEEWTSAPAPLPAHATTDNYFGADNHLGNLFVPLFDNDGAGSTSNVGTNWGVEVHPSISNGLTFTETGDGTATTFNNVAAGYVHNLGTDTPDVAVWVDGIKQADVTATVTGASTTTVDSVTVTPAPANAAVVVVKFSA